MQTPVFRTVLLFILMTGIFSCDYVDPPYTVPGPNGCTIAEPSFTSNPNPVRKVMIDEFTGHWCGNCPQAHQVADNILSNPSYEGRVLMVAHHSEGAGDFTKPWSPNLENKYVYDFRNQISTDLDHKYNELAYPLGMVNRKDYSGSKHVSHGNWEGYSANILATEPVVDIQIKNFYSPGEFSICSYYYVEALEDLAGEYKIVLYLTEDSIIQWQKNTIPVLVEIPDYEHKHVLRTSFNGYFGTPINDNGDMNAGEKIINGYSISIANSDWNVEHLNVVAFVYNVATDEIIQAEQVKVIP